MVDAAAVGGKRSFLSREISLGSGRCPVMTDLMFAGWARTTETATPPFTKEKSAEAIVPVGDLEAGKGRTPERGSLDQLAEEAMMVANLDNRGLHGGK